MNTNTDCEIYSSRVLEFSVEKVYRAFAEVEHLKDWWGPEGFTNTIHEFDLKPGGNWILTMHGPEVGHYENASVFTTVVPMELVAWQRKSKPLFAMEVGFKKLDDARTEISFRMIFDSAEECNKIKGFATPKNEENFDRLERELLKVG
ncbi:SRPBCC domain-containing protein [Flavobacterium capsici]|uniref:SRPBCC domain-containing protein n=1 Tax=Flavobacterium capsici TaxID=3075618 RepID=A0AA96J9A6_9FLAO|nr:MULTISPECIES: SRPBCC domain-containing protein [unclassified Flavobacterium]WNM20324.1 SRPBCC domain-containing protein [Flavobacterium sp. PMR2A8]WNM21714.1 SRPBCC domain-containing protein [Flavobacterium sp. PMTSA4]